LHLGFTEAGMGAKGIVASSAAMGVLLQEASAIHPGLATPPHCQTTIARRSQVGQQILNQLPHSHPQVTACQDAVALPALSSEMAQQIQSYLRDQMPVWKGHYTGVERDESRSDGLCGKQPRRIETRQPRHFVAGNVRRTRGPGLRGRPSLHH
jgi:(E)-4-hydroxy-3-methylbut-2-enyl-diphosphate synthase